MNESDLEIIHENGDVTDKRDGVRRSYEDHIANFARAAAHAPLPASTPRWVNQSRLLRRIGPALAGGVAGAAIVVISHHL